jgi:hypothetical protein
MREKMNIIIQFSHKEINQVFFSIKIKISFHDCMMKNPMIEMKKENKVPFVVALIFLKPIKSKTIIKQIALNSHILMMFIQVVLM